MQNPLYCRFMLNLGSQCLRVEHHDMYQSVNMMMHTETTGRILFSPTTLLRHCCNHDSDCIDVQVMCQTCQCCVPCEVNDETRCFQLPKKAGGFPVTTCQRGRANLKFRLAHPTVFLDLSWIWWWNWAGSWWGFYPTGVKTAFFFGYDQTWDIGWIQSTYIAQWEKTCSHAAMVSWLVEVSCLTRCQLGDDKLRWVESNLNNQVSIVDS